MCLQRCAKKLDERISLPPRLVALARPEFYNFSGRRSMQCLSITTTTTATLRFGYRSRRVSRRRCSDRTGQVLYPPYMGVRGWVGIELDAVSDEELGYHLCEAWRLIAPPKMQSTFGPAGRRVRTNL